MSKSASQPAVETGSSPQSLLGKEIGQYRLVRLIGRGGMGAVYEALHTSIGQRAAVKVLSASFTGHQEMAQRFHNEARASSRVQHPGLVKIFDFGQMEGGRAFILMELLVGESLRKRLSKTGPLPMDIAVVIARQIATAVQAAHEKGIIHRDLKPENIFLVPEPEVEFGERAKVLDFGIAKLREISDSGEDDLPSNPSGNPSGGEASLRTTTGSLLGTPAYMSPEQCLGEGEVSEQTDVYALGAILFQMLTGRTPFLGAPGELISQHLSKEPPLLRSLSRSAPAHLESLISSMLQKTPTLRPTMAEIVALLSGEQVALRKPRPRRLSYGEMTILGGILVTSLGLTYLLWPTKKPSAPSVKAPPANTLPEDKYKTSGQAPEPAQNPTLDTKPKPPQPNDVRPTKPKPTKPAVRPPDEKFEIPIVR